MSALLNRSFLESIGVNLSDEEYVALSQHYEETLNERVINEIVDELDEDQLGELTHLRSEDIQLLQQWLVVNIPQLDEIIEDEIAILLGEMADEADHL